MTHDPQKIQKLIDSCFFLPKDMREKLRKINEDGSERQRRLLFRMLEKINAEYQSMTSDPTKKQELEQGIKKAKEITEKKLLKAVEKKEKQNLDDDLIQKLKSI